MGQLRQSRREAVQLWLQPVSLPEVGKVGGGLCPSHSFSVTLNKDWEISQGRERRTHFADSRIGEQQQQKNYSSSEPSRHQENCQDFLTLGLSLPCLPQQFVLTASLWNEVMLSVSQEVAHGSRLECQPCHCQNAGQTGSMSPASLHAQL